MHPISIVLFTLNDIPYPKIVLGLGAVLTGLALYKMVAVLFSAHKR